MRIAMRIEQHLLEQATTSMHREQQLKAVLWTCLMELAIQNDRVCHIITREKDADRWPNSSKRTILRLRLIPSILHVGLPFDILIFLFLFSCFVTFSQLFLCPGHQCCKECCIIALLEYSLSTTKCNGHPRSAPAKINTFIQKTAVSMSLYVSLAISITFKSPAHELQSKL